MQCFKSFNKIQTVNKRRSASDKNKSKLCYTEVYDVNSRQQQKHNSNHLRESINLDSPSDNLVEFFKVLSDKYTENQKSNKLKPKSIPHKQIYDLRSFQHEAPSQKLRIGNKVYPILQRENPIKKRDYIVKQIPLEREILEFPIDRNQCPMVVRVHKGHLSDRLKRRHGDKTSHSQPSSNNSNSCPLCIADKPKVTSEKTKLKYKKKQQKSKCGLMSHGYTISDLLNLSPRNRSRLDTRKKSRKDKSNKKIISKNKCQLLKSYKNERTYSYVKVDLDKKEPYNKKSAKQHKILVKENDNERHGKTFDIEVKDDKSDSHHNLNSYNGQNTLNKNSFFKKQGGIKFTMKNVELDEKCKKDQDENLLGQTKQPCSVGRVSAAQKIKMCNDNSYFLQSQTENEMSEERQSDCNCHECKKDQMQGIKKKETFVIKCQPSLDIPGSTDSVNSSICIPKHLVKKKVDVPEYVTLAASQSQFHKISAFLKNKAFGCGQKTKLEQLPLSPPTTNHNLIIDDRNSSNSSNSKKHIQPKIFEQTRKSRSEEKNLNKCNDLNNLNKPSNNKDYGSYLNSSRYNASFPSLNKLHNTTTAPELGQEEPNICPDSPHYKCLGCNKNFSEIKNFVSYCSDCKLKAKLSQISNESTDTNPVSESKLGLLTSEIALTNITESDISITKNLVNVAIQTDCGLENYSYEHKNTIVKSNVSIHEHVSKPNKSLENILKMYYKMVSQVEKVQGSLNFNTNESVINDDLQCNKNHYGGGFESGFLGRELGGSLPLGKTLILAHSDPEETFTTVGNFSRPIFTSLEPKIQSSKAGINTYDCQKQNNLPNENCSFNFSKYKSPESRFVSPIFPEKEYNRINYNKHNQYLAASKCSNRTLKAKCPVRQASNCSQEYVQNSSYINVKSRSDQEYSDKSKSLSLEKEMKSIEASYISCKAKNYFNKFVKNSVSFINSKSRESSEENDTLSICERGALMIQVKDISPDKGMRDLLSAEHLKSIANKSSKESHKENSRHTLPRVTKNQDLNNCISSPCQSFQFKNSADRLMACHITSDKTPVTERKDRGLINNQVGNNLSSEIAEEITERKHCLQQTCSPNIQGTNSSFYTSLNISKFDLNFKLTRDNADVERKMNYDIGSLTDSFKFPTNIRNQSKTNMSLSGISQTTEKFQLKSFSYLLFNISMPEKDYNSSNNGENFKNRHTFRNSWVLMPEKANDKQDSELNHVVNGNLFQTEINNSLMIRKESNSHEFNVFELKSLSKVEEGGGSDIPAKTLDTDNLENKPLVYRTISPITEVNKLDKKAVVEEKINHFVQLEKTMSSTLVETNCDNVRKTSLEKMDEKSLNKNNFVQPTKKKSKNKKSRKRKNKFTKINNLFMRGYMVQMSFFHFVDGLQKRVCSGIRK